METRCGRGLKWTVGPLPSWHALTQAHQLDAMSQKVASRIWLAKWKPEGDNRKPLDKNPRKVGLQLCVQPAARTTVVTAMHSTISSCAPSLPAPEPCATENTRRLRPG